MSENLQQNQASEEFTIYGTVGIAVFLIFFGVAYLVPNTFPEGSLFVLAGVLILLVNIIKSIKRIGYDMFDLLLSIALIVAGLNKIFHLELRYIPAFIVLLGAVLLIKNIKKLK